MFSATVEPFEVAAVIEQDRRFHSSSSSSTAASEDDEEAKVPLVSHADFTSIPPSSSSSVSGNPPVVGRRSSLASFLDSLRVSLDSMKANVKASVANVQHGVQDKASSLTYRAEEGVKQWTFDVKHSFQQLLEAPNSLVCGGCQRELAIPPSAFQWVCTRGHENNFVEPTCKGKTEEIGRDGVGGVSTKLEQASNQEEKKETTEKERAVESALTSLSTSSSSSSSSSPSSSFCGESRPSNLEWPSVRCPFPSCSHITPIPRTQASAILRAGVSTLSSSVSALSHPPSSMFHCGFCNCLLSVPLGEWQCQACTEVCPEASNECQKCGQKKNQQKLLCGLCHHSTSIPSSALTDSIRSGLKAMKEQARKLAFTAIGQAYVDCPYCGHSQAITDEMLGLGLEEDHTKIEKAGEKEKERETGRTKATAKEEALGGSNDATEKYESSNDVQIKPSSSPSASSPSTTVTPAPTSADADLLLATSTIPPPSTMFSLSDEPIPCQLCSNSFYVLYGKEGGREKSSKEKEENQGKQKGGRVMARRQSSVKERTQTMETHKDEGPKKVEDTEDLIDKTLAAP